MRGLRVWMAAGLLAALAAGGCGSGHEPDDEPADEPVIAASARRPEPFNPADSAEVNARIAVTADSARARFAGIRKLRWREIFGLKRDKNAEQIARAQSLGVRASDSTQIQRLVKSGRLVPLGDSTEYWVLRKMTHSVPYVTPDTRAMLVELGKRFHARLDSAGVPRYRMKVTSALRTDETQASLRRTNPNASQTVSAHEFGTTVDVSHARFAVPAPPRADTVALEVRRMEMEVMEEVGKEHARELQAALGRALIQMRAEGALMVMMESGQPVYHFTVARRFPKGE